MLLFARSVIGAPGGFLFKASVFTSSAGKRAGRTYGRHYWLLGLMAMALVLAGCAGRRPRVAPSIAIPGTPAGGAPIVQAKSRWVPVPWSTVPGITADTVGEAWPAWLQSCRKPGPVFAHVCTEVQRMAHTSDEDKRRWLMQRFQPYRIESHAGQTEGLLTSYYEPVLQARRQPGAGYNVPLYAPPAGGAPRSAWYTRRQIDTDPAARAALQGRALLYVADPIDAMILHIQGSGRVQVQEADGRIRMVRLAFAGTNNHPFRSPSSWVMAQGGTGGSWDALRQWAARNPGRVNEMLWSNPRYVFFREEAVSAGEGATGPRGAHGVPLTPGRSIAVDRGSIPYGVPVWLSSSGAAAQLNRLVLAQDTGTAIVGAVRADYFAGWSPEAAALAHRLKQPLWLWAIWPR